MESLIIGFIAVCYLIAVASLAGLVSNFIGSGQRAHFKPLFTIALVVALVVGGTANFLYLTRFTPFNRPTVVQVETNEIAFLVSMVDASHEAGQQEFSLDNRRDIVIRGHWIQTGFFRPSGHFRPTHRVLVVSQRPVNLIWDDVRAVSMESVGFRIPLVINASIQSAEDAELYLRWFRSSDSSGGIREEAMSLEQALNNVILPIVTNRLSEQFLTVPIVEAERNRVDFVRMAFELAQEEAKQYGITIMTLASTDGLIYDDINFQARINDLAVASMRENILRQEQINAQSEQEVALIRARTAQQEAQILSSTINVQRQQAEIRVIEIVGEAEAAAIRRRAENQWPSTLIIQDLEMLGSLGVVPGR
ncbi:MAG: SPFH domain-containing protein [Spirochaetaceae bacterium]|nr:SPFH domain-containing protein [Spirochaetaceae bacterium]